MRSRDPGIHLQQPQIPPAQDKIQTADSTQIRSRRNGLGHCHRLLPQRLRQTDRPSIAAPEKFPRPRTQGTPAAELQTGPQQDSPASGEKKHHRHGRPRHPPLPQHPLCPPWFRRTRPTVVRISQPQHTRPTSTPLRLQQPVAARPLSGTGHRLRKPHTSASHPATQIPPVANGADCGRSTTGDRSAAAAQFLQQIRSILETTGPDQRHIRRNRPQQPRQIRKTLQSPQKPATAELQQLQQIPITEKIAAQRLQSSSDCRFRQRSHTGSRQHDLFSHRNPPLPLRFRRNCGSTGPVS